MPIPSSLQTLLLQFQSRYPLGGLCAELLTIHQNQYVVRALVQVGNMMVASAMAAAPELEAAEERAKTRALECLGLTAGLMSGPPTLNVPNLEIPEAALNATGNAPLNPGPARVAPGPAAESRLNRFTPPTSSWDGEPGADQAAGQAAVPPVETLGPSELDATSGLDLPGSEPAASASRLLPISPAVSSAVSPAISPAVSSTLSPAANSITSPVSPAPASPDLTEGDTPTVSFTPTKPEKTSSKRKPEPVEVPAASSVDRSQEVMRIGIEMKRLGWSTEQGREYLKRTYGKRSRQELDDAELLDFLHYLESQPSTLQAPF